MIGMHATLSAPFGSSVKEYKMINSVTIENFRCFNRIELHGLGNINLLVGDNGSGKTAFLEALYLAIGVGPGLALRIRGWRGYDKLKISDRASFEDIWSDLFFHFDQNRPILITEIDANNNARSLTISYKSGEDYRVPVQSAEDAEATTQEAIPLDFEYRIGGNEPQHAKVEMAGTELKVGAIREAVPGVFFGFGAHHGPNTVTRFSNLVKQNREVEVLRSVRSMFPQITGLTVAEHSGQSVMFASVEGIPERKLPLGLVSMGIDKYMGILLSIMDNPKGVVLVDEIDSGLHFTKLVKIWKSLHAQAKRDRAQVIASTHSKECISALYEALKDEPDDLGIINFKRVNGESRAASFSGKEAICAFEQGFDLR